MREYLDQMGAPTQLPAPDAAYPKIIGANGPKMLALAGEIADGAMPAMVPPEFTAQARQLLGPDKLLVVGLAVAAEADPERAKATARQTIAGRLAAPGTYAATMARLGYSEQEIAEVRDRLLDALVGYGGAAAIAAKVREHLAAGADHVMVMPTRTSLTASSSSNSWLRRWPGSPARRFHRGRSAGDRLQVRLKRSDRSRPD
jgi:probable F420-dependent oxidoreductase